MKKIAAFDRDRRHVPLRRQVYRYLALHRKPQATEILQAASGYFQAPQNEDAASGSSLVHPMIGPLFVLATGLGLGFSSPLLFSST